MKDRSTPTLSVAICSADRSEELKLVLDSLKLQIYSDFKIICVLGPGSEIDSKYAETFDDLTIITTLERNLSLSRNLALNECRTELIAYIDDDARAEPGWTNQIASSFLLDEIGVVGGWSKDRDGNTWQVMYAATDILGRNTFSVTEVESDFLKNGVLFRTPRPQGANCAFRVNALRQAGGFDEYLVWNFDETEAAFRVLELGYKFHCNPRAIVHHYSAASDLRDASGIPKDSYYQWRSRSYFTTKRSLGYLSQTNILRIILQEYAEFRIWLNRVFLDGRLSHEKKQFLLERSLLGIQDGLKFGFEKFMEKKTDRKSDLELRHSKSLRQIALVTVEWPDESNGGIGRWYQEIATEIAKQGVVVTLIGPGSDIRRFRDGYWESRIGSGWHYFPGTEFIPLSKEKSAFIASIREELNRINNTSRLDAVIVPSWGGLGIGLTGPWKLGITLHTSKNSVSNIEENFKQQIGLDSNEITNEIEALRRADLIIANSKSVIGQFSHRTFPLPKTIVVPHGMAEFSLSVKKTSQIIPKLTCEHKHFIFIGRNEPRKNPRLALEIIRQLGERGAKGFGLILVGEGTNELKLSKNLSGACIHAMGAISEVHKNELIAQSYCLLITSVYESFGLTALEAMRMGKPVISTKVGGLMEVIKDKESGFLFDLESVEAAIEACLLLLNESNLSKSMGEKGRQIFENDFTIEENARKILVEILHK